MPYQESIYANKVFLQIIPTEFSAVTDIPTLEQLFGNHRLSDSDDLKTVTYKWVLFLVAYQYDDCTDDGEVVTGEGYGGMRFQRRMSKSFTHLTADVEEIQRLSRGGLHARYHNPIY